LNKHRAIALGLGLTVLAFGTGSAYAQTTGVRGIDKFATAGPETVMVVPSGICTRFLPMSAARSGSRPGLGWANGTTATPQVYAGILNRVASYGTLVTAANTTNAGTGREVSQCIDELVRDRPDSNGRFATAGHSQGGSGTLNAARLNTKVVVTCPVQLDGIFTANSSPADLRGTRTGPALIMCGGADVLAPCTSVNNGDTKFNQATVPVTRISVVNAPHVGAGSPTGNGGLYAALVTTCIEAALDGDAEASAALQPGGAVDNGVINRIASRNFDAGPGDPDQLAQLAAAVAALQRLIAALGGPLTF
jgi:hypothetical protein